MRQCFASVLVGDLGKPDEAMFEEGLVGDLGKPDAAVFAGFLVGDLGKRLEVSSLSSR